jgi:MSHA biogenesis protein MshN
MSLLNQVLQDLQDRQAPDVNTAQTTLRDVHVPSHRGARAAQRPWVLWTAIVILAALSGNLLWQRGQQGKVMNAAPARSAPPTTRAATPRPAQQPTVAPAVPAIAAAEAHAATSTPSHTIPIAAAAVDHTVTADHAPVVAPVPQPTPAPPAPATARDPLAPQERAVADVPAAAIVTAKKKAVAANTAPVSKPATAPHTDAVEKTARPLSAEQQAELDYQDGLRLLQSGRPTAAEPRLHAALDSYPAHRAARTALAGLLINAGRLPEATSLLAAGLALAPTYAPFAKLYARLRIDQGELAEARTVLERAAPAVQDDPEYYALLAALYQRLGLYEQAAQTYRGVLQVQPRNGVWWLGLGLALEGGGDRANALQAYQRAQQSGTLDGDVQHYVESKITALR